MLDSLKHRVYGSTTHLLPVSERDRPIVTSLLLVPVDETVVFPT